MLTSRCRRVWFPVRQACCRRPGTRAGQGFRRSLGEALSFGHGSKRPVPVQSRTPDAPRCQRTARREAEGHRGASRLVWNESDPAGTGTSAGIVQPLKGPRRLRPMLRCSVASARWRAASSGTASRAAHHSSPLRSSYSNFFYLPVPQGGFEFRRSTAGAVLLVTGVFLIAVLPPRPGRRGAAPSASCGGT